MKKRVCFLPLLLCCALMSRAQDGWKIPHLEELTQSDTIKRKSAQLSPEEIRLLKHATQRIVTECADDPGPGDPKTADGNFRQILVRRVTLTSNGESGLLAQGSGVCMCGAVGNCPLWLIRGGKQPRVLLHAIGIQTYEFDKRRAAGHYDLILGSHDSAMVTDLQRFRFNGIKYQRAGCAMIEWSDADNNALSPPKISSLRCW